MTSLFVASDGRFYAGESLATAGGVASPNLAAWDGATFHSIGGGIPGVTNTFVFALAEHQGDLIAGGNFGSIGGLLVDNVARFDGQQWRAMNGGVGDWTISSNVQSLAVHQGSLYVGGSFTHFQGFPAEGLARLDPVTGWQPAAGDVKGAVLDLRADHQSGRPFVAGGFQRIVDGATTIFSHSVGILDLRAPWVDLGLALPRRATPLFTGRGAPTGPNASSFELRNAPPGKPGLFAFGLGDGDLLLLGGVLVPPPDLLVTFRADLHGTWRIDLPLPTGCW